MLHGAGHRRRDDEGGAGVRELQPPQEGVAVMTTKPGHNWQHLVTAWQEDVAVMNINTSESDLND